MPTTNRHTFESTRDQSGSKNSWVSLGSDGELQAGIHDLGQSVEDYFDMYEYESFTTWSADQTAAIAQGFGVDLDGLIGAIAQRFPTSLSQFEAFVTTLDVGQPRFWSHVGD